MNVYRYHINGGMEAEKGEPIGIPPTGGGYGDPAPSMDKDPGSEGGGARGSGDAHASSSSRTLGSGKAASSGTSFHSQRHDLHLRIFDGDLYDSVGYDIFQPHPASFESVQYFGSEGKWLQPLSAQSTETNPSFSVIGMASSPGTPGASVPSKDAHEHTKGPPVDIYLFTLLQQEADGAVWEGGARLPGSARLVEVVAKLAFSDKILGDLIHENNVYSYLSRNPHVQLSLPTCYGVYYLESDKDLGTIALLFTSLVPGTTANRLNSTELMATIPSIRDAVNALHERGVTHGGIAGRNIIVHERKATLIDFGKARITTDSRSRQNDLDAVDRLQNKYSH